MASVTRRTTNGFVFRVDEADAAFVDSLPWYADRAKRTYYVRTARRDVVPSGLLHRHLLGATPGSRVDHRDGDGLNNTRLNLRFCTHAENARNVRRHRDSSQRFKGVIFHTNPKRKKRFQASIMVGGVRRSLGYFLTDVEAAHAYDAAARQHHGQFAQTNFSILNAP